MIAFRQLPDGHPALTYSPLLRAALRTLQHAEDKGGIPLTQTKAFKRSFVRWAAEHFNWPGMSAEELFRFSKVVNEYDFPPLELLHFLLVKRKLGRHEKGVFRLTNFGKEVVQHPGQLFSVLVPFYLLNIDHSSYDRFGERPLGSWDVWLNVMNMEMNQGAPEAQLYNVFYGDEPDRNGDNWRDRAIFASCVLRPLEWSGLIQKQTVEHGDTSEWYYFKTPLWRSGLELDLDEDLPPIQHH